MLCIYIYIYVYICIYIYTVYIIDKTYVMWLNSLVNLSIKHHQVVKMALWVCHSTWKNSSICGWWTYSTVSTISGKKVDLWRNQKTPCKRFSSDPNNRWNQVEHFFTFSHVRGVPQSTTRIFVRPSMVPIWCGQFFHLGQVGLCTWHKHNGYAKK